MNPYAAPRTRSTRAPTHSPALKYVYLGAWITNVALSASAAAIALSRDLRERASLDTFTALDVSARIAAASMIIVALLWIHKSWSLLPPNFRTTRAGRTITPAGAVGWLFVPCFNFYWAFVVSIGLCDGLEDVLFHYGVRRKMPRALAVTACICQLIPLINIAIAPLVWFIYMTRIDAIKRHMLELFEREGID